ncbi:hypothetical protein I302_101236 [Kwoniella bestiolae CBS 10118]|uniref:SAP domain-containing protein n=1 Tax=Kwoniella bestiolae CBS 10118 TaxID=1296100 RepID=A0AAJ8K1M8_9TREE
MADEILRNSAALNALKRHQLVSLSKRYGLKASGKNVELIQRLEDYAISHANDLDFYIPSPAPTPGPNMFPEPSSSEPPTPLASHTITFNNMNALAPTPLKHKDSMMSVQSRASDAWEMLSESGASLISPKKQSGMTKSSSCSSWKSANNGEAIGEFGGHHNEKVSSTSSMKALATSLTRRGSKILLGRSTSASSQLSQGADPEPELEAESQPEVASGPIEEVVESIPPSPASTVGVPRRHSRITLLERPSTVRLCSPTPTSPRLDPESEHEDDELPFFGKAKNIHNLKERRSMAPIRSSIGSTTALSQNGLSRKSMPAMSSATSASISSIYPPLPAIPPQFARAISPQPPVPGSFPPLPPTPSRMVFGSPTAEGGVSNHQFSDAAQAVLREMNAKLPGGVMFGEELLKGRKAEMDKLVQVNKGLGTGGWGLSSSTGGSDRYAEAHQKEFAKMRSISKTSLAPKLSGSRQISSSSIAKPSSASRIDQPSTAPPVAQAKRKHELTSSTSTTHLIPSAPNGAPMTATLSNEEGRQAKRTRLSNGPNYLGSLREAGKSIANLLGEEKGKSTEDMMKVMRDRRDKRRSSLLRKKGRGISSRFGFLRNKKASTLPTTDVAATIPSVQSPPLPAPTMPRKTSVYAPRDPPHGRIPFDLEASLARKPTATRRRSTDLTNVIKPHPEVLEDIRSPTSSAVPKSQKDRGRSTSAQTMMSQSGSQAPRRAKIPDFAPPGGMHRAASGSTNTLGLPKSSSVSSSLAMSKKASQAEIIRNARPAPPPPSSFETPRVGSSSTRPASINRSSTLYLPTASSLARMQATIKPNPERPLPMLPPPVLSTPRITSTVQLQPFGSAQSRDNQSFTSNFNTSKPTPTATSLKPKTSQGAMGKSQSSAAARIRARQSGLSAVKSRTNLREEMEVKRKKEEIKARMERREEERELREMLGEVGR